MPRRASASGPRPLCTSELCMPKQCTRRCTTTRCTQFACPLPLLRHPRPCRAKVGRRGLERRPSASRKTARQRLRGPAAATRPPGPPGLPRRGCWPCSCGSSARCCGSSGAPRAARCVRSAPCQRSVPPSCTPAPDPHHWAWPPPHRSSGGRGSPSPLQSGCQWSWPPPSLGPQQLPELAAVCCPVGLAALMPSPSLRTCLPGRQMQQSIAAPLAPAGR